MQKNLKTLWVYIFIVNDDMTHLLFSKAQLFVQCAALFATGYGVPRI